MSKNILLMLNSKIKMLVLLKPKWQRGQLEQNDHNVNIKNKNHHDKILFLFGKISIEQEMQVLQYQ